MVRRFSMIDSNFESYIDTDNGENAERKRRVGPMDAVEKHLVF